MHRNISKQKSVFIIFAIFAISINMRPAITSIGPMLETIREQLLLSNAQVSLLTAVPVICMGVFATMAPVLNRKFGVKHTIYTMLIIIAIMTLLRGFISSFLILIGTAFLIGIAIAVIGPLLSAMIKQYFPERAASVIGIYSFGMGVGSAASAGLTAVFFERTGSYLFALSSWSVLALLGLVAWSLAMKGNMEVRQLASIVVKDKQKKMKSPWKTRKAWLFLLFFGLQSSAFFSIITWLAPIAISAGMTLLQAGTLLSIMTTVQIFLNILLPLLMERFPARKFWLLLMLIAGMLAVFLFWTGMYPLMWAGAFIMGIPLGGLFPVALLLPLDETRTAEEASSWTAMMQTGGFIIGGLLPLLIAVVYDGTENHHYTFGIILLLYVMMFILTFMIGDKKILNDL
ncbi:CynX/NimT family MFS transporter [Sporosarcina sp. JAI121]|uniref:MFS transporter n=1 Tax=Sporosarcina sp. JAI121 TaxID=2723064 RepID=UPI0018395094|nr:MFS transporter [Sporosarcina sp. JAI121]NYF24707.1 CP family cyanate transporter-like MFS transporter [Sporosarcina sp. JAI121]